MSSHSNHYYNKNLQPYANRLRKEMTKAEACLWKNVLRASQLKGFPFKRQRPVLSYIADFMCKELMLIVEVDGSIHQLEEIIEKDKFRQKELETAGFTVLRFTNEEVLTNIQSVIHSLEEWIEKHPGSKVNGTSI
jgi:very-short-patch-repair endonuclease